MAIIRRAKFIFSTSIIPPQLKMAPTVSLSVILIVHVGDTFGVPGVTAQFADQPPKVDAPGASVRVTVEPIGKFPTQPAPVPQLITLAGVVFGDETVPILALLPTLYMVSVANWVPFAVASSVNVDVAVTTVSFGEVAIAVIVVVPGLIPVARPVALIVATFTSLELQAT